MLDEAKTAIQRNRLGKPARGFVFVGLGGVGRTVLLNEVQAVANEDGAPADFPEVAANEPLSGSIISALRTALLKLDLAEGVGEMVKQGLRVLRIKFETVEFSVDVDAETGTADSGRPSRDLDAHLVTFDADGRIRFGPQLWDDDIAPSGLDAGMRLRRPDPETELRLKRHRVRVTES